MNEKKLSKQEERELLALQCELARLKMQVSRQRIEQQKKIKTHDNHQLMNAAQIASDVLSNPLWKMSLLRGGKQKWWIGAMLLLWQMYSGKQK